MLSSLDQARVEAEARRCYLGYKGLVILKITKQFYDNNIQHVKVQFRMVNDMVFQKRPCFITITPNLLG